MKKILEMADFKIHKENLYAVFALIFSVIFIKIFNLESIPENSVLENIQLVALFGGFVVCLFTKKYKVFYTFLAMLLFLMIARELSYGRAIFGRIPGTVDQFYTWSHYKYGYLAHIIVGIYIAIGVLYALIKKIWVDVIEMVKNVKFPVWTFLASFACVFIQIYSEKYLHNSCIEETAEFVLYCLILALILIYRKK